MVSKVSKKLSNGNYQGILKKGQQKGVDAKKYIPFC